MSDAPRIPMLDLAAQTARIRAEIDDALARVVSSGHYVRGPEVEAFEREFAASCAADAAPLHAVGCASGSDALLLALMAHGVSANDEVLCPAFTHFASASAAARLGARPVFVDVDPASGLVEPDTVRQAARGCGRLRAIVPVDLFGRMVDGAGFAALGRELGVPIVEDAAQAVGARDGEGRGPGARSDVACFSLYPTKNLGAFGDAGILLCRSGALADRLRSLREHGESAAYIHQAVGINSRLDALQAAVLRVKLRHLETWTKARREHAALYDGLFARAGALPMNERAPADARGADGALPVWTPAAPAEPARHVYHHYVVRVPAAHRDPLRARLTESGIATGVYYPLGLHQQPCFAGSDEAVVPLPETEAAARECLALPVHGDLADGAVAEIAETVIDYFQRGDGR